MNQYGKPGGNNFCAHILFNGSFARGASARFARAECIWGRGRVRVWGDCADANRHRDAQKLCAGATRAAPGAPPGRGWRSSKTRSIILAHKEENAPLRGCVYHKGALDAVRFSENRLFRKDEQRDFQEVYYNHNQDENQN